MFAYYINTVQIMDMFRKAVVTLRTETRSIIMLEMIKVDQEYAVGIFILIILFIISPLMVFLVRNAVNSLQVFSASVRVKARALKREKKKAESLITQMLPKTVAENLKQNKSTSEVRLFRPENFFRRVLVCCNNCISRCSTLPPFASPRLRGSRP